MQCITGAALSIAKILNMIPLNIEPYSNVGPLFFGMNVDQVVAILGPAERVTTNRRNELCYQYDTLIARFSQNDLVEITITPNAKDVSIRSVQIYADKEAFVKLVKLDGQPIECVGFIVFLNLGVMLSGFHDKDEDQKAVTVFIRGRIDNLKEKFKPFIISA